MIWIHCRGSPDDSHGFSWDFHRIFIMITAAVPCRRRAVPAHCRSVGGPAPTGQSAVKLKMRESCTHHTSSVRHDTASVVAYRYCSTVVPASDKLNLPTRLPGTLPSVHAPRCTLAPGWCAQGILEHYHCSGSHFAVSSFCRNVDSVKCAQFCCGRYNLLARVRESN